MAGGTNADRARRLLVAMLLLPPLLGHAGTGVAMDTGVAIETRGHGTWQLGGRCYGNWGCPGDRSVARGRWVAMETREASDVAVETGGHWVLHVEDARGGLLGSYGDGGGVAMEAEGPGVAHGGCKEGGIALRAPRAMAPGGSEQSRGGGCRGIGGQLPSGLGAPALPGPGGGARAQPALWPLPALQHPLRAGQGPGARLGRGREASPEGSSPGPHLSGLDGRLQPARSPPAPIPKAAETPQSLLCLPRAAGDRPPCALAPAAWSPLAATAPWSCFPPRRGLAPWSPSPPAAGSRGNGHAALLRHPRAAAPALRGGPGQLCSSPPREGGVVLPDERWRANEG